MKAIVYTEYGPPEVLRLIDMEKPSPGDNEVLIRIYATTVTATECIFRKGKPYFSRLFTGMRKPKNTMLGEELAGEVEAAGKAVKSFNKGDQVFGTAGPKFGGKKARIATTGLRPEKERKKDLMLLKELMESGDIKPVIDRKYPLEEIVEAHRYVDQGHKKGNVVITITPED